MRGLRLEAAGTNFIDGLEITKPFYERLAAIDSAEVKAAIKQLDAENDFYVKQKARNMDRDAEARARGAQMRADARPAAGVREVEFAWEDGKQSGRLRAIDGCLPAGPGTDVVWAGNGLYLMKQPGRLKRVWQGAINSGFSMIVGSSLRAAHVCYDGRFVWAAAATYGGEAAHLLVVDPQTETVAEFTAQDGLPLSKTVATGSSLKQFMALAPLSPGKACIAGSFGQTWLAIATFEPPGRKELKVFHEAREAANRENADQPKGVDVAFPPSFMFTLIDPHDADRRPRVIVGRGELQSAQPGEYPPLIVDPERLIVAALVPAARLELRMSTSAAKAAVDRGGIYMFWTGPRIAKGIYQLGLPDFKPELVLPDAPDGFVAFTNEHMHIIGRDWWTCRRDEKKLRRVAEALPWWFTSNWFVPGRPAEPPETPEIPRMEAVFPSNHYGLLVKRAWSKLHEAATFEVSGLLKTAGAPPAEETNCK